ncbi:hypothetical protein CEP53_008110 [Fusarium sp. AF-6]|nr:hypothetical protein CEP53_008110 [Fusarium sp. AF-6]
MPPVRTTKQNTAANDAAPVAKRPPKTMRLKAIPKAKISTGTRTITFGSEFILTDRHVEDILALGPGVCGGLWQFIFQFKDVSYDAKNKASLTTDAVVRLAKACPKLRKIELPGAGNVGEDGLLALFEHCPALTHLDLSKFGCPVGGHGITGTSLDALRENPEWAPKLKKLLLAKDDNKEFMKAMRALGKERPAMIITLMSRSEEKKWGDWQMVAIKQNYKKGRKHDANPSYGRYNRYW